LAVTLDNLWPGLGLTGRREAERIVQDLVGKGRPVGSTSAGIFICIDADDWKAAHRYLAGREITQRRRLRAFKRTAREKQDGQRYLALEAEGAEMREAQGTLFAGKA
jgi:putative intracellular protease/amidase